MTRTQMAPSRRRRAGPPGGAAERSGASRRAALHSEILAPGTQPTYNNNQPTEDNSELTKNQLPLAPLSAPPHFPNEASLLRLVSALLCEISEDWLTGKIYLNMNPADLLLN